jgi:Flp pilus assembly protein CpaB
MKIKDSVPIVLASLIALVITAIVKWLVPSSQSTVKEIKEEIPMPDIPLMAKDKTKRKSMEIYVAVAAKDIKKDEKITGSSCSWKRWPEDALQQYFIAKDKNNVPLNNGADYSNALKMWAKADIPGGVPLTIQMLTEEDPVKKAQEENEKKKKETEKKAKEEDGGEHGIRKGMRAVTFSLDQRSVAATSMIGLGDLVDIIIMEEKEGKQKIHKYKGLKVIAIDGLTKKEQEKEKESLLGGSSFGSAVGRNILNIVNAKQITLEVKETMVEVMLTQAGSSGIIVSVRNQDEPIDEKELDIDLEGLDNVPVENSILNEILSINHHNSMDKLLKVREQRESTDNNVENIIDNINIANGMYGNKAVETLVNNNFERIAKKAADDAKKTAEEEMKKTLKKELEKIKKANEKNKSTDSSVSSAGATADSSSIVKGMQTAVTTGMQKAAKMLGAETIEKDSLGGGFEIISGKIVGEEIKAEQEEKKAIIYKKLTVQEVKFEDDGSIMDPNKKQDIGDKIGNKILPS